MKVHNYIPKFQIYSNNVDKVIAVTKYHGKTIRAVAKCSPEDTFDMDTGIKIAVARCKVRFLEEKRSFYSHKFDEGVKQKEAIINNTFETLNALKRTSLELLSAEYELVEIYNRYNDN